MSRRMMMMLRTFKADSSAEPVSVKVLHGDTRQGGNLPLYNLMNGLFSMLGIRHSLNFFTMAELGKFNSKLDCSFAPALEHFKCSVPGYSFNILNLLPNCKVLDAHNHTGLKPQDVSCSEMNEVTEIRFDGTAVKNIDIDDLEELESIRFGVNATALKFKNNSNLLINL